MISLNDYLYNGDTVLKILHNYAGDLSKPSVNPEKYPEEHDHCAGIVYDRGSTEVDLLHAQYLNGIIQLLEHNDFLTSQSQRIREFYKYMAECYPYLAFTFKGRIKALLRAEEKFNRNLIEYTDKLYEEYGDLNCLTSDTRIFAQLQERILDIRDLIAYRIVLSMPKCHVREGVDASRLEIDALYEIAERLPSFLSQLKFAPEILPTAKKYRSSHLSGDVRDFYKDYIEHPTKLGYQALHIVFYDEVAKCKYEIQLRTKSMDDYAEIGAASHESYEKDQTKFQTDRKIPEGKIRYYDDAYERVVQLQELDLSRIDVNMFAALNNMQINDGCGLYRSRLILPYEHLSRFQNDLIG